MVALILFLKLEYDFIRFLISQGANLEYSLIHSLTVDDISTEADSIIFLLNFLISKLLSCSNYLAWLNFSIKIILLFSQMRKVIGIKLV